MSLKSLAEYLPTAAASMLVAVTFILRDNFINSIQPYFAKDLCGDRAQAQKVTNKANTVKHWFLRSCENCAISPFTNRLLFNVFVAKLVTRVLI